MAQCLREIGSRIETTGRILSFRKLEVRVRCNSLICKVVVYCIVLGVLKVGIDIMPNSTSLKLSRRSVSRNRPIFKRTLRIVKVIRTSVCESHS